MFLAVRDLTECWFESFCFVNELHKRLSGFFGGEDEGSGCCLAAD